MLTLNLILLSVLGYIGYQLYKTFRVSKYMSKIPTVSFLKLLMSYLQDVSFEIQMETIFQPALDKGDGVAKLWRSGRYELMLSKLEHIKEVLADGDLFLKKPADLVDKTLVARFFGDNSLFSVDGEEWRRHRKVMNPPLKQKWDPEIFAELTLKMVDRIQTQGEGSAISVLSMFQELTLDALGIALLGYDFRALELASDDVNFKLYHDLQKAMFNPIYFMFPILEDLIPWRKQAHDKLRQFKQFMLEIITERKLQIEADRAGDDLLTLMIQSSKNVEGAYMTDAEILDNLTGFFLAGHDTTANTLTSTLYFLARHKDVQEKARQEVLEVLGKDTETSPVTPTFEQQKSFKYLDKVIKESMRTISTVPQLVRYCELGATLSDGLVIPPKTFVGLLQWIPLHQQNVYPQPNHFDPERFENTKKEAELHWIPFGYGGRMCAGMSFSLTEQRVVLAILLQKFHMVLGPNSKTKEKPHLSATGLVRPSNLDIVFKPRC